MLTTATTSWKKQTPREPWYARYSDGLNIDEPLAMMRSSTTSYYHADGLGSVTSLSNAAGALAQTYGYDAFGKQTSSSGSLTNPFQYTARESDTETSLYYYRARYYDQSIGRFLSEDPTRDHENWYAYTGNRPTVFNDPSGLHSLFYDGKDISVFDDSGALVFKCRATSGRPGTSPADQNKPWEGPIPRGV